VIVEMHLDAVSFHGLTRLCRRRHGKQGRCCRLRSEAAIRILGDAGQTEAGQTWRGQAAARYDELLAQHQDAFADHAAEFWLTVGGDRERALSLARHNLSLRQTPRARALVRRSMVGQTHRGEKRHVHK
jgi:hypothetical protein